MPDPRPCRPRPFWHADKHTDRRPRLLARNRIKAAIRAWFLGQGFIEVETTALQVSPGNETHLHAFATDAEDEAGGRRRLYLHTSPEFAMKKLLAAGEERIFSFAPVWRNRERGALHAPEFTMLEWYRVGAPLSRLVSDACAIAALAASNGGREEASLTWRGRTVVPAEKPEIWTLSAAFARLARIDLLATLGPGDPDRDALATAVAGQGIRVAPDDTWSDLFSRVLVERIEPALAASSQLVILSDYPAPEAALARRSAADPRVSERFELYACGVELANAFGELIDPMEQRRRLEAEMTEKARLYGERYPIDEDFLAALTHMPAASGAALGFDRLVMLATGASHIDDVQWTPVTG